MSIALCELLLDCIFEAVSHMPIVKVRVVVFKKFVVPFGHLLSVFAKLLIPV